MDYIFVKFFGLSHGLGSFWSRPQNLRSQNLRVLISVSEKLLGLGLDVYGLDYITAKNALNTMAYSQKLNK